MNPKWYGISEDWLLQYGNQPLRPIEAWTALIPRLKSWGFNVARLAFRFPDAPATSYNVLNLDLLEQILTLLSENGIKAVLDCHNYNDHLGWFGSPAWKADWAALAEHVKGDPRIVGLELFNEPTTDTWYSTITTAQQAILALGECADVIRATGNRHTLIYPAPWYYRGAAPEDTRKDYIVIDWHSYSSAETIADAEAKVGADIPGMLIWMNRFPLWVGEVGILPQHNYDAQKAYVVGTIDNCVGSNTGFALWAYSLDHWHVGSYDEILAASNYKPPSPGPDLATIGGIALGIADLALIGYGAAKLTGLI